MDFLSDWVRNRGPKVSVIRSGKPSIEQFQKVERFGCLDGLRALSIVAVLWAHSGMSYPDWPLLTRGQMGVYLFFAISGFLITTLMIRERRLSGRISLRGFYTRRALRIFPLYYAVISVYVLLVLLTEKGPAGEQFFDNLPYFLTYTNNWFVTLEEGERVIFFFAWSLATEEQFYMTWPWVERYARPAIRRVILGALISVVAAAQFGLLLWLFPADSLGHMILWSVAPPILFGVVAAHAVHTRAGFSVLAATIGYRWSAPLVLAVLVGLLSFPPFGRVWEWLIYVMLVVLVLSCVIREDNGLSHILKQRLIVRVGVVSYGIYLMHLLCFAASERVGLLLGIENPFVLWGAGMVLVYLVAEVSFTTFERYFLSLKPGGLKKVRATV